MIGELIIRVPGRPVAWARAGRKIHAGPKPWVQTFTPTHVQQWEDRVANEAHKVAEAAGWIQPSRDLPLCIDIDWHFERASGIRKGVVWKFKKPDRDNLDKACLDALVLACVIADDAQAVDGRIRKLIDEQWQGAIIRITEAEGADMPTGHKSRPMPVAQGVLTL